MTTPFSISGTFVTPSGGTNGASVDAWKASRSAGILAEGASPPSGVADAGVVITGTTYGCPGSWIINVPTNEPYNVRVQYSGTSYWGLSTPVLNTASVANGQTNSFLVDNGGQVYNVKSSLFGATGNGTTDDTAAIELAITTASSAGGGTIFFPEGIYLVSSGITLPTTGVVTNYLPGSPAIYQSNPIRMMGVSASRNARGDTPFAGSIIKFDPSSAATFITGYGSGQFEFDHLTIQDASSQSNLFFRFTNSVSNIHDNLFCGNETFTSCWTDLITYGVLGATTSNGGSNAIFNGYGSSLQDNNLVQMRHLGFLCSGANGITIKNNTVANTCGTNDADSLPAPLVLSTAIGNIIENNTFELSGGTTSSPGPNDNGYRYAIYFANESSNNTIKGNGFWDPSTSVVAGMSFDNTCSENMYVEGYRPSSLTWAVGNTVGQTNVRAVPELIGAGTTITGSAPQPQQGGYFIQAATITASTDSNGYIATGFPATFPNGVLSVTATCNGTANVVQAGVCWVGQVFNVSTSGFEVYIQAPPGSTANKSASWTVSYTAIGF